MALGVPILKHFRVLPNIWDYGKSGQTLGSRQNGHFTHEETLVDRTPLL